MKILREIISECGNLITGALLGILVILVIFSKLGVFDVSYQPILIRPAIMEHPAQEKAPTPLPRPTPDRRGEKTV
jgi:hypothetical protein